MSEAGCAEKGDCDVNDMGAGCDGGAEEIWVEGLGELDEADGEDSPSSCLLEPSVGMGDRLRIHGRVQGLWLGREKQVPCGNDKRERRG